MSIFDDDVNVNDVAFCKLCTWLGKVNDTNKDNDGYATCPNCGSWVEVDE